jgi:uncharacterized coiled-coil protein SlyX
MDEHQLKRLELLESKLHEHIEHYANNNKALAILAQRMEDFNSMFTHHQMSEEIYQQRVDEHIKVFEAIVSKLERLDLDSMKGVLDSYHGLLSVRSLLTGVASVLIAIGSIGAAVTWVYNKLHS